MGNFKTHEMEMKARENREPHKKISVAIKASSREHKKKNITTPTISDDEQGDDEKTHSPSEKHEKNVPQEWREKWPKKERQDERKKSHHLRFR